MLTLHVNKHELNWIIIIIIIIIKSHLTVTKDK
jgi:hypothetical protein